MSCRPKKQAGFRWQDTSRLDLGTTPVGCKVTSLLAAENLSALRSPLLNFTPVHAPSYCPRSDLQRRAENLEKLCRMVLCPGETPGWPCVPSGTSSAKYGILTRPLLAQKTKNDAREAPGKPSAPSCCHVRHTHQLRDPLRRALLKPLSSV